MKLLDLLRSQASDILSVELDNGPDARNPIPNGCPACKGGFDGDLEWARIIDWKWYPDMNHYMVECECGFSAEVIA